MGILILEGRRVTGEFRDDGWLVSFALEIRSKKREGESIETGGRERKIESKSLFKNARLLKRIS